MFECKAVIYNTARDDCIMKLTLKIQLTKHGSVLEDILFIHWMIYVSMANDDAMILTGEN
jgi:hypothetical protein